MSTILLTFAWHHLVWLAIGVTIAARTSSPARAHRTLCWSTAAGLVTSLFARAVGVLGGGLWSASHVELLSPSRGTSPGSVVLFVAWALLSAAVGLKALRGMRQTRTLMRSARRCDSSKVASCLDEATRRVGMDRPIDCRTSEALSAPAIWCWGRRPTIVIPQRIPTRLETEEMTGLLCHELAHLRRRDHWAQLLFTLLVILVPWSPLAWLARRRALDLVELACDRDAVMTGLSPTTYARSLVNLATKEAPAFALGAGSIQTRLGRRVHAVLESSLAEDQRVGRVGLGLASSALAVLLAFTQARPARQFTFIGPDESVLTWTADDNASNVWVDSEDLPSHLGESVFAVPTNVRFIHERPESKR